MILNSIVFHHSRAAGGMVDAGPAFQKDMSDEVSKLQRLYGGGDMETFPAIKFTGQLLETYWVLKTKTWINFGQMPAKLLFFFLLVRKNT